MQLHTIAAYYPDHPTVQEQQAAKEFFHALAVLYPCKHCAADFVESLGNHAPQTASRTDLALWVCHQHNLVNEKLGEWGAWLCVGVGVGVWVWVWMSGCACVGVWVRAVRVCLHVPLCQCVCVYPCVPTLPSHPVWSPVFGTCTWLPGRGCRCDIHARGPHSSPPPPSEPSPSIFVTWPYPYP